MQIQVNGRKTKKRMFALISDQDSIYVVADVTSVVMPSLVRLYPTRQLHQNVYEMSTAYVIYYSVYSMHSTQASVCISKVMKAVSPGLLLSYCAL